MVQSSTRRSEGFFLGLYDNELFYQKWEFANSKGILVISHGLGEHSESYQRLADGIANSGWDIFAWDLKGHGRSAGKRGTVRNFDDYGTDLLTFLNMIKKNNPEKPIVLLGHSMGGLITAKFLIDHGPQGTKATVLSSPLLGIRLHVPEAKRKAAQLIAKYLPKFTLYNEMPDHYLVRDKKVITEYQHDPLRHDRISASLYLGMLDSMQTVLFHGEEIKGPILIQQAGQDQVVNAEKTKELFGRISSTQKKLILYETSKHEVYNDLDREKAYADLKEWLSQWLN